MRRLEVLERLAVRRALLWDFGGILFGRIGRIGGGGGFRAHRARGGFRVYNSGKRTHTRPAGEEYVLTEREAGT